MRCWPGKSISVPRPASSYFGHFMEKYVASVIRDSRLCPGKDAEISNIIRQLRENAGFYNKNPQRKSKKETR